MQVIEGKHDFVAYNTLVVNLPFCVIHPVHHIVTLASRNTVKDTYHFIIDDEYPELPSRYELLYKHRVVMRKGSKWLSAFLESYRPPLDGERYLTDGEVSELLRVSRRTLQEYRNNRVLPFILLGGKVLYPETGLRGVLEANYRKPLE